MIRKIGMNRDESWRKMEIFSTTTIPVKPRLHIHDFLYDSPRFTPISHGRKIRGQSWWIVAKSRNIQCHYDSSKSVHGISTVSVRYRYESMTIHDGNATVNED